MKKKILDLMYHLSVGNINYEYASKQVLDLFADSGSGCECSEPIPQMTNRGLYCLRCQTPIKLKQSEQLYCNCSRAKGLDHDDDGMPYCIECQKPVQF